MMKKYTHACYLDSSILIGLSEKRHEFHDHCNQILSHIIEARHLPVISSLTLDETIHILTRNQVIVSHDQASALALVRTAITNICTILPDLIIINPPSETNQYLQVLDYMAKYHLHARDAYHLLIIAHHKIPTLATLDTDFHLPAKQLGLQLAC